MICLSYPSGSSNNLATIMTNINNFSFLKKSLKILVKMYVAQFSKKFLFIYIVCHMPYDTISGSKMANSMVSFHNFIIFEKLSICLAKDLCEKVSKIKNMRCMFPSFFHADCHDIFFVCHMQPYLVRNWPRKWVIFIFFII